MPLPSTTSLTLLARAQAGDEAAWTRIVDIYGPFLLGRLKSRGLSEADAADVLQEVFKSVSNAIDGFKRDRPGDSFLNWLQTITSNRLTDFVRRQAKQPGLAAGGSTIQQRLLETPDPLADEDWSTDAVAQQTILQRALKIMKAEFREKTWKAFWLSVIDEKETTEICAELDMKPGAVRQARSKVRKRLAEELGDVFGVPPDKNGPPS